jgi:hypothetical protein
MNQIEMIAAIAGRSLQSAIDSIAIPSFSAVHAGSTGTR